MANGAHCRFQNALHDLRDCHEHLGADLSEGEARARTKLLELCQDILADAENMGLIRPTEVIGLPETGDFPRGTDGVLLGPIAAPMPITDDVLPIRMMDGDRPVVAYIDGACSGNPGPGGWGVVVLKSDGSFHEASGSSGGPTTNNRMELQAAIELLSRLPANAETFVYADAQYVVKGMTEWLVG
jgi:hypothetical protein